MKFEFKKFSKRVRSLGYLRDSALRNFNKFFFLDFGKSFSPIKNIEIQKKGPFSKSFRNIGKSGKADKIRKIPNPALDSFIHVSRVEKL